MMTSTSFAEGIKNFFKSSKEENAKLTEQPPSAAAEPKTPLTSDKSSSDVYILLNSNLCHLNLGGSGSCFNSSAIKTEPSDEIIVLDSDSDTEMPSKNSEPSQTTKYSGSFFNSSAIKTEPSDEVIVIDSDSDTEMPSKNREPSQTTRYLTSEISESDAASKSMLTTQSECDTTTTLVDEDDDVNIVDDSEYAPYSNVKDSPSQIIENSNDEVPESGNLLIPNVGSNNSQSDCVTSTPIVETDHITFADNPECTGFSNEGEAENAGYPNDILPENASYPNEVEPECAGYPNEIDPECAGYPNEIEPECAGYPNEIDPECVSYYPNNVDLQYAPYLITGDSDSVLPAHSIFEPDITFTEESEELKMDEGENESQVIEAPDAVCDKCGKQVSLEVATGDEPNLCSCNSSSLSNVQVSHEIDPNVQGTGDENSNQICAFCKKEIRGNMQYHCEFRCPSTETWRLLCNICSDSFTGPYSLINHVQAAHDTKITVDDALQSQRVKNSPSSRDEESNVCPYCKKESRNKSSLLRHCEFHCTATETYRLVCDICSQGMSGQRSLVLHYRVKHKLEITIKMANNFKRIKTSECLKRPKSSEENKTCTFCKKRFSCINDFNDHCDFHCPKSKKFKLLCHICSIPYAGPASLKSHLFHSHKIKTNREFIYSKSKKIRCDEINSEEEQLVPKPTKPLYCVHCNKEFPSHYKKALQIHIDFQCPANKETFELVCEVCNDSFNGPYSLKNHLLKAHDISVTPSIAASAQRIKSKIKSDGYSKLVSKLPSNTNDNSKEADISNLSKAMKKSDNVKSDIPFRTQDPSQNIVDNDDDVSMPNNSEENRNYVWSDGKTTNKTQVLKQPIFQNLTKHQPLKNKNSVQNLRAVNLLKFFVQSGFKPSSCICPICGKYVYSPSFLKIHMRKHTNEKPFHCRKCGRGFFTKVAMKYHVIAKCPKRKVIQETRTNSSHNSFQTEVQKRKNFPEQNEEIYFKKAALKTINDYSSPDETDTDSDSSNEETRIQSTGKCSSQKLSRKHGTKRSEKYFYSGKISGRESSKEVFSKEKRKEIRDSRSGKRGLSETKTSERNVKLSHDKYSEESYQSSSDKSDGRISCDSSNEETDSESTQLHSRKKVKQSSGPTGTKEKHENFRSSSRKNIRVQDKNRRRSYDKVISEKSEYSSSDESDSKMSCDSSNEETNTQSTKSYCHRSSGRSSETTSPSSKFVGNKRSTNNKFADKYSHSAKVSRSYSQRKSFTVLKNKQFNTSIRKNVQKDISTGRKLLERKSRNKAALRNKNASESTDKSDTVLASDSSNDDSCSQSSAQSEFPRKSKKSCSKSITHSRKFVGNKRSMKNNKKDSNNPRDFEKSSEDNTRDFETSSEENNRDSEINSEKETLNEERKKKHCRANNQVDNTSKNLNAQKSRRPSSKSVLNNSDCSSTEESDSEMVIDSSKNVTGSQFKNKLESHRKNRKSDSDTANPSSKITEDKSSSHNKLRDDNPRNNRVLENNSPKEVSPVEKQRNFRRSSRKSVQTDKYIPESSKSVSSRKRKRSCTKVASLYRECSSTNESDLDISSENDNKEVTNQSDREQNNKRQAENDLSEDGSSQSNNSGTPPFNETLSVEKKKNVKCRYCCRSFMYQGIYWHEQCCKKKYLRDSSNEDNPPEIQAKKSIEASENNGLSSQDNKRSNELESAKINLKSQQFLLICGQCGLESRWPTSMKQHSLRFHDKFDLTCKTCKGRFTKYDGLRDHLKLNGRYYYCDKKENVIPDNQEIIVISDDSSSDSISDNDGNSEKIFECKTCTKKYPTISALIKHLEQHLTNE